MSVQAPHDHSPSGRMRTASASSEGPLRCGTGAERDERRDVVPSSFLPPFRFLPPFLPPFFSFRGAESPSAALPFLSFFCCLAAVDFFSARLAVLPR